MICKIIFPKINIPVTKSTIRFFLCFLYEFAAKLFLGKALKNSNWKGEVWVWGSGVIKNLTPTVCFRKRGAGGSFKLDGCGQRGWWSKNLLFFVDVING